MSRFLGSLGEFLTVLFDSEFHRLGAVADIAKVAVHAIYEGHVSVSHLTRYDPRGDRGTTVQPGPGYRRGSERRQ